MYGSRISLQYYSVYILIEETSDEYFHKFINALLTKVITQLMKEACQNHSRKKSIKRFLIFLRLPFTRNRSKTSGRHYYARSDIYILACTVSFSTYATRSPRNSGHPLDTLMLGRKTAFPNRDFSHENLC